MIGFDAYVLISVVSAIIYLFLIAGILLLFRKRIAGFVYAVKYRRRLSSPRFKNTNVSGLSKHLDNVLAAVMRRPVSSTAFLVGVIGLFFLVFILSASNLSVGVSVVVGLSFAVLPYLFLRVKLERLRRRGSFEGENLISSLLTQYWVSGGNIFNTLERTIMTGDGIRITGKLLSTMLLEIRNTGNKERIRKATEAFAYGVNTNWSKMLAYHIGTAAVGGNDISLAIEDILVQLREARSLAEERKRINGESVRIVIFLIPLIYAGSVFVSIRLLGLGFSGFFRNQFMTAGGFGFFSVITFLFMLNIVLLEIITNKKLDF
ncbi:MAG: hypothetical protein LBO81_00855 [Clostridiales Family XIII bacterium]|jgi:hypothetical protein|nr:hypothetical protein [Clostridiales Family XIII bacterium]